MNIKKYYKNESWLRYLILGLFVLIVVALLLSIRFNLSRSFQMVFGSVYLLFLPGFVWSWVFWKKSDDIDFMERMILSIVLSLTIIPLSVFMINKLGVGINKLNSSLEILGIIALGIIIKLALSKLSQKKHLAKS